MKTITHELLDVEASYAGNRKVAYETIDSILIQAKKKVETNLDPEDVLTYIDMLLTENKFSYWRTQENFNYIDGSLFTDAIGMREVNCVHLSALYFSIGEALNLPIRFVFAPNP